MYDSILISGGKERIKGRFLGLLTRRDHGRINPVKKRSDRLSASNSINSFQAAYPDAQVLGNLIGQSQVFKDFLDQVTRAAETDCRVLLIGEKGTGKELLAHIIHEKSPRRHQPLIKIDCTRNASDFLDEESDHGPQKSVLGLSFQHTDHARTGENGTLFFDEIGDLSQDHQSKLLRFLLNTDQQYPQTFSNLSTDSRIIASTSRDLRWDMVTRRFRVDLFFRLNVISLRIPPLRERIEDIPILAQHFVKKHARKYGKSAEKVNENTLRGFIDYPWPGNVRELGTVIERAVINSQGPVLDIQPPALG